MEVTVRKLDESGVHLEDVVLRAEVTVPPETAFINAARESVINALLERGCHAISNTVHIDIYPDVDVADLETTPAPTGTTVSARGLQGEGARFLIDTFLTVGPGVASKSPLIFRPEDE